jgi:hypothetical protein
MYKSQLRSGSAHSQKDPGGYRLSAFLVYTPKFNMAAKIVGKKEVIQHLLLSHCELYSVNLTQKRPFIRYGATGQKWAFSAR